METEIVGSLLGWGLMCALCALAGKNRSIGYFWTFVLLCLCLSPLIGLIIALCSKKKGTEFSEVKNTDNPTTEKQEENINK